MYSIMIYDSSGSFIGELPAASAQEVMGYINKGFKVKDKVTGNELALVDVSSAVGTSDGFIEIWYTYNYHGYDGEHPLIIH